MPNPTPKSELPWWCAPVGALVLVAVVMTAKWLQMAQTWAAHLSPTAWVGTIGVALVLVSLSLFVIFMVVSWVVGRGDIGDVPRRLPRAHRGRMAPGQRLFLGWAQGFFGQRVPAWGRPNDSSLTIGISGSGKTDGQAIPQLLLHTGSAIAASTKTATLEATLERRRQIGKVWLWAPGELEAVCGLEPMDIDLLGQTGCSDGMKAQQGATSIVGASLNRTHGPDPDPMWAGLSAAQLATLFHAAARSQRTLVDVMAWLRSHDADTISAALKGGEAAWAQDIQRHQELPDRTRGSVDVTSSRAMLPVRVSRVLTRCSTAGFDIDSFIRNNETLYIVGSRAAQAVVAPLTAWLVEAICDRRIALGQEQQDVSRVLVQLDEWPSIAPMPGLRNLLAQGQQLGLTFSLFSQSWSLVEELYGQVGATAIEEGVPIVNVFRGVRPGPFLDRIAAGIPPKRVKRETNGPGGISSHWEEEPRMSAVQISHMKPYRMLTECPEPFILTTRRVSKVRAFRDLMRSPEEAERRRNRGKRVRATILNALRPQSQPQAMPAPAQTSDHVADE